MTIKPLQAVYPNLDYITSADSFFDRVKFDFPEQVKNGFFHKTTQEGMYVYQIRNNRRSYTGLIACASIRDFFEGRIKKHENTIANGEQQQMELMISRSATVKPVLQTYRAVPEINDFLHELIEGKDPFLKIYFEEDKNEHLLWEITDRKAIKHLRNLFADRVPCTYIADGHHRTTTTALLYERMKEKKLAGAYDLLLSVYFPSSELEIHEFNRVIEGLNDLSLTHFMARISLVCDIEVLQQPIKPARKHEMVMYLNREWYKLTWKRQFWKEENDNNVVLDVSLLNEKILKNILGIANLRSDERVKYVEGPKGWEGIRKNISRPDSVAFYLYPVQLEDLMHIADAGQTLPPKSTWFEPRIKNGLIVHEH